MDIPWSKFADYVNGFPISLGGQEVETIVDTKCDGRSTALTNSSTQRAIPRSTNLDEIHVTLAQHIFKVPFGLFKLLRQVIGDLMLLLLCYALKSVVIKTKLNIKPGTTINIT